MFSSLLKSRTVSAILIRCLTEAAAPSQQQQSGQVSKQAMLALRKRTGYSFMNCRNALLKFGENNMDEAEKYLKELAVKEGWQKAAKVGGRQTLQGQCGVITSGNMAAVVELKCETDFVGRSDVFKDLVAEITLGVLKYAQTNPSVVRTQFSKAEDDVNSAELDIKQLKTAGGIPVEEAIACTIGKLGENISFTSAHLLYSHDDAFVYGVAHPQEKVKNVSIGRFVSAVGIKRQSGKSSIPTEKVAYNLCQHVIGMNPKVLGTPKSERDEQAADKKVDKEKDVIEEKEEDELNAFAKVDSTKMDEEESQLLRQSFMLNPSQTIGDYVEDMDVEIVDFWRFELAKSGDPDERVDAEGKNKN